MGLPARRGLSRNTAGVRSLTCRVQPLLAWRAGSLELGESARAGAAREAMEEAGAVAVPGPLLAVYDVPGSVQLCYLSRLRASPGLGPRHESSDVRFFRWCVRLLQPLAAQAASAALRLRALFFFHQGRASGG